MDLSLAKTLLSRFTPEAFAEYLPELFGRNRDEPFEPLAELGDNVYAQPILDSYGGSLHRVFVSHYLPFEIFSNPAALLINDPALVSTLRCIREGYRRSLGQWGMVSPHLVPAAKLQTLAFLTN